MLDTQINVQTGYTLKKQNIVMVDTNVILDDILHYLLICYTIVIYLIQQRSSIQIVWTECKISTWVQVCLYKTHKIINVDLNNRKEKL